MCDALGFDSSDYSFAYVARWSDGATELIKDTAERVIGCAKQILEGLEDVGQSAYRDVWRDRQSSEV